MIWMSYDYFEDYDICYECTGYGDNYYENEDGELMCRCPECPNNREDLMENV